MSMLKKVMRGSLRANSTKVNSSKANEPAEINLGLGGGLDLLDKIEAAEERDYTVPHTLRCLYDTREADNHRYNLRFVRSGLVVKDDKGVKHGVYIEITPVATQEQIDALEYQSVGTLVIRVADVPRVLETVPFYDKNGRATGDYRIRCVCAPTFVSFKPVTATSREDKIDNKDEE